MDTGIMRCIADISWNGGQSSEHSGMVEDNCDGITAGSNIWSHRIATGGTHGSVHAAVVMKSMDPALTRRPEPLTKAWMREGILGIYRDP